MTAHDLARAAQTVRKSNRRYTPMEPYIPAVDVLRRKGWSWAAIHTWLHAQGQHVQNSPSTFAACMGRCYRRWLSREVARQTPKAIDVSLPAESNAKASLADIAPREPSAKRHRHPHRKHGGNGNTTRTDNTAATIGTTTTSPAEPPPPETKP